EAGGRHHHYGRAHERVVIVRYPPRVDWNFYRSDLYDPYTYRFEPRRWYPYYNSGYWRPTPVLRYRRACCRQTYYPLPPYYQAWGYPRAVYVQKRWKHRHVRRHRHW